MAMFGQSQDEANPYAYGGPVAVTDAPAETRVDFIRKTYLHLLGAIAAFAAIEVIIFQVVGDEKLGAFTAMLFGNPILWLGVLGGFMVVGWVADRWAQSATSVPMQYAGLGLYVVAQAVLFVPMLYVANAFGGGDVIGTAAIITLAMFAALTLIVFTTRVDFSFLRGILMIGMFAAMGTIVAAAFMGFSLGMIFTVLMVTLASGYILYYTSNVMNHYQPGQHVAASLALFAAVALLFWYVLRLVMILSRE